MIFLGLWVLFVGGFGGGWWPWHAARGESVAHEWVSRFAWNLHEWVSGFVWDLCDWVCSNLGILALVLGLWILFAGGLLLIERWENLGLSCDFEYLGFCSWFMFLCVLILIFLKKNLLLQWIFNNILIPSLITSVISVCWLTERIKITRVNWFKD